MADTYGVGFYGFGFIGKVHAYGYRTLPLYFDPMPLRARMVGVCTSRQETAERARETLDFEFCTTDYHDLLARDDIQIVHCCTPNNLHHDFLVDAVRAGKHIYCDKPLALNAEEAVDLARVMRQTGYSGKHQMTFQYRFLPATLRARQLIEDGFLGRVFGYRAQYLHSGYINPDRPISWRLDAGKSGAGALGDLGSHILDLVYCLLGEYSELGADLETFIKERPLKDGSGRRPVEVDDIAVINTRMADGSIGVVEAWRLATGAEDELRFEIHGQNGALRFNLMDPNWLEAYDARDPDKPIGGTRGWKRIGTVQRYPAPGGFPAPKLSVGWIRSHVQCLYNFLRCIAEDDAPRPSMEDGAYIQLVMDTAQQSDRQKKRLKVPTLDDAL